MALLEIHNKKSAFEMEFKDTLDYFHLDIGILISCPKEKNQPIPFHSAHKQ